MADDKRELSTKINDERDAMIMKHEVEEDPVKKQEPEKEPDGTAKSDANLGGAVDKLRKGAKD
ncbi:hypothetical protein U9M48_005185 [Paspalum notatum var. saurae]|uniref:Uncharacterized protein n=1 Tax=Paspalum notatum var. saurae TaxID=547442 RepID=A0AAQ3SJN9_PASNO